MYPLSKEQLLKMVKDEKGECDGPELATQMLFNWLLEPQMVWMASNGFPDLRSGCRKSAFWRKALQLVAFLCCHTLCNWSFLSLNHAIRHVLAKFFVQLDGPSNSSAARLGSPSNASFPFLVGSQRPRNRDRID
jgi:hypothetical protein